MAKGQWWSSVYRFKEDDQMSVNQLKAAVSKGRGFASTNQFLVELPSLGVYDTRELNVLCTNVNVPGRQILTQERLIGLKARKMPNGFASDDINLTFHVMNDYNIRKYFETWQDEVINQDTYEIGYANKFTKQVRIKQLKKGMAFDFPIDKIFGLNLDLDITTRESIVYECTLLDAFPTTMNSIEFTNELDGLVKLSVQLSYTNWTSK
jgi:hypothetical protein